MTSCLLHCSKAWKDKKEKHVELSTCNVPRIQRGNPRTFPLKRNHPSVAFQNMEASPIHTQQVCVYGKWTHTTAMGW